MARPATFPLGDYIPALQGIGVSAHQSLLFARGATGQMSASALGKLRGSELSFLEGVGGVRRQNFLWQWGAVARNYQLRERLGAQEMTHTPTASEVTKGRYPRARGYQYNVDVLIRNTSTGVMHFTPMGVITDTLLTHGEAIMAAVANLRDVQTQHHSAGNIDTLTFTIMAGGVVTSVIERLPEILESDEE